MAENKHNFWNRFLAILLAVVTISGSFSVPAFAKDTDKTKTETGYVAEDAETGDDEAVKAWYNSDDSEAASEEESDEYNIATERETTDETRVLGFRADQAELTPAEVEMSEDVEVRAILVII